MSPEPTAASARALRGRDAGGVGVDASDDVRTHDDVGASEVLEAPAATDAIGTPAAPEPPEPPEHPDAPDSPVRTSSTRFTDELRATAGRPAGAVPSTRWLFCLLALLSLAIALPLPILEASPAEAALLAAASAALTISWTASYFRQRTGAVADVVDTVAFFTFALASAIPSEAFIVVISALWFRSLYGPLWRIVLRPVAYSAALGAAVAVWPHVLDRAAPVDGEDMHVLASLPLLFLTVVVAHRLASVLADRERYEAVGKVYAAANADLIGLTDDAAIRGVAACADVGFCGAVPGLRIAKVDAEGDDIVFIGIRGPWAKPPERLPASIIDQGTDIPACVEQRVTDPEALNDSVGTRCAWLALPLPVVERLGVRSWLLVGAPKAVPRPLVSALQNLANHMALAYAVAQAHSELTMRATTDALTGLANRAAFTAALTAALERGVEPDVSVLFIDLDDFKSINDRFGHEAGDQVLREVAGRLRRAARPGDVCARLGGDEFAVLLPGAGADAAEQAAQRLADSIRAPLRRVGDVLVPLSASVGAATVPAGTDPETLLRQADAAMYTAKRSQPRR